MGETQDLEFRYPSKKHWKICSQTIRFLGLQNWAENLACRASLWISGLSCFSPGNTTESIFPSLFQHFHYWSCRNLVVQKQQKLKVTGQFPSAPNLIIGSIWLSSNLRQRKKVESYLVWVIWPIPTDTICTLASVTLQSKCDLNVEASFSNVVLKYLNVSSPGRDLNVLLGRSKTWNTWVFRYYREGDYIWN